MNISQTMTLISDTTRQHEAGLLTKSDALDILMDAESAMHDMADISLLPGNVERFESAAKAAGRAAHILRNRDHNDAVRDDLLCGTHVLPYGAPGGFLLESFGCMHTATVVLHNGPVKSLGNFFRYYVKCMLHRVGILRIKEFTGATT